MTEFNPKPDAFQISGAASGGSVVCAGPRSPFSGAEETALASGLLQAASDAELDQLFGDLIKKAWRGADPVGPKVVGPLGGLLKTVAKEALPSVASAASGLFAGPASAARAGKLGGLVRHALNAGAAKPAAPGGELEKCRQLLERRRQFVRLAGRAARAAASAPTGTTPIAAAQKALEDSAKEKIARRAAAPPGDGNFAQRAPVARTAKPGAAGRTSPSVSGGFPALGALRTSAAAGPSARRKTRIETQAASGAVCSICALPPGSCECVKVGRSGRWYRSGSSIIVNC